MICAGAPAQIWAGRCPYCLICSVTTVRSGSFSFLPSVNARDLKTKGNPPCSLAAAFVPLASHACRRPQATHARRFAAPTRQPPVSTTLVPRPPHASYIGDCSSPAGQFQLATIVAAASPRVTASTPLIAVVRLDHRVPLRKKISAKTNNLLICRQ